MTRVFPVFPVVHTIWAVRILKELADALKNVILKGLRIEAIRFNIVVN